ncbi:unnamed protein product [Effrenium voratum]|uniref:J domain-containing protein n=1 Tax=Effrenium voratum TaxID=2562239 RepID=A0AA36IE61_9DINO|nr:unnamed protein product [Effrenium voratum]CAJ1385985.1 unnamed protein product [Effrenium voratum]
MEDELERQAQVMAEKALSALPEAARAGKIAKVKEGILKRLKEQANAASPPVPMPAPAAPVPAGIPAPVTMVAPPSTNTAAPESDGPQKLPGIEVLGDELWFSFLPTRRALRERVVAAHAGQKILVAAPAIEVKRICPGPGRILGAGAVLRLGGSTLGGYGEADVNYAYRQLSRALHPDKNPDIPEAHDAFKRLTDAAAELKEGLEEQRNVLRAICLTMGVVVTPEMTERPQEALFAEANRMLHAVLGLTGEGEVPGPALSRSLAVFTAAAAWTNCRPQVLLSEWFDHTRLLDLFALFPMRTAYDCAPKRYRAQFLCALNRATMAEAKRNHDCVRGNWQTVMMQYPEIGLWRDLREKIKVRVWTPDAEPGAKTRRGSMWDDEEGKRSSKWADTWRERIRNILPRGIDSFVGCNDKEVRQLAAALWKDIAEWVKEDPQGPRLLSLFTAEPTVAPDGTEVPAVDEWAFVPVGDILLVVGEGIVGITAEGLGAADAKPGHERMTFADVMQGKRQRVKAEDDKEKKRSKDDKERSTSRERRKIAKDKDGKPVNDPDFNWEKVWRERVNLSKTRPRTARSPSRRRSRSRRRRSRSRVRRDRSRRRRISISGSRSGSR